MSKKIYKKQCEQCNIEFDAKRKETRFCLYCGLRRGKGAPKGCVPWSKGKTAKDFPSIISGERHHQYGKPIYTKETHPELAAKILASQQGINKGDKNGMKKPECRQRRSELNKQMWADGKFDHMAKVMRDHWKNGSFEDVKVGRCKWFTYTTKAGKEVKLQGTWELAFAKWADENNLTFDAHRGNIPYEKDGSHNYYPDFYVNEWESYVEIKNDYHLAMQKEKIDAIIKSNPGIKLRILTKDDLIKLGVPLP